MKTLNYNAGVWSVAIDSTHLLASGSSDSTVKLWEKNSGDQLRSLTDHASYVQAVAFDSNNIKNLESIKTERNIFVKNQVQIFPSYIMGFRKKIKRVKKSLTFWFYNKRFIVRCFFEFIFCYFQRKNFIYFRFNSFCN